MIPPPIMNAVQESLQSGPVFDATAYLPVFVSDFTIISHVEYCRRLTARRTLCGWRVTAVRPDEKIAYIKIVGASVVTRRPSGRLRVREVADAGNRRRQ